MSFTGAITLWLAMHASAPPLPAAAPDGTRDLFPGVRINPAAKLVEFDATITPMLVKDDRAPLFYLEVIACAPNTREHETILITTARPSHIHAALLAIGLTSGTPGSWSLKDNALVAAPPTGDRITVRIAYADKDGTEIEADPLDWVVNARTKDAFLREEPARSAKASLPGPGWVFAGSKIVKRPNAAGEAAEMYDADGSGTIIGLTTFGSEVIAWSRVISPDASVDEPEWIVDFSKTPPAETKVRVRIRKAAP